MAGKRRKGKDPVPPTPVEPPPAAEPTPPPATEPPLASPTDAEPVQPPPVPTYTEPVVPPPAPPPQPEPAPPPPEPPLPEPPLPPPLPEPPLPPPLPEPPLPVEPPAPPPPVIPPMMPPTGGFAAPPDAPMTFGSPTPPATLPVVMAPPVTRRQARQARRRQQHRRIGLLGGVAIAVATIVIISAIAFGVHKVETGSHGSTRSQSTLLMQIQGTDRTAAASVLLAHNSATKSGVVVLVPPRVISEVCGYGSQNFGNVLALPNGAALSRQTMSMMLNDVTVDGSWVLSEAQLAKFIDVYGGITVDVDTNVVQRTNGGGGQILIPAGTNEHLDGAKAVEYALYSTSAQTGGPAQLTRLNRVVDGLLQALPTNPTPIAASLRQLGPSGSSTLGVDKLSTMLAGLASDSRSAAGVFPTDLPVTPIDAGGLSPSYRIDTSATGVPQLVHNQLAASLPADANRVRPRVLLLNGVGTPGLVLSACARLSANGYSYAGSGNAADFNNPTSSVVIKSDSDPNVALGDAVAKALRLPTGDVVHATENQDVADVVVILGNDYHP